jgi:hypothetical protein
MTRDQLAACTRKELSDLARRKGVPGWHDLRKEDLITALRLAFRKEARRKKRANPDRGAVISAAERTVPRPSALPELTPQPPRGLSAAHREDRVLLVVRDPYWLHCYWELSRQALERAEAALGTEWHAARPILRLYDVSSDGVSSAAEQALRDIDIHGGCNNWYIEAPSPPRSYRVDLGYLTQKGKLYVVGRSNPVTTPQPGKSDAADGNWADLDASKAGRLYVMSSGFEAEGGGIPALRKMFEERTGRPVGGPAVVSLGTGGLGLAGQPVPFGLEVDAEVVVQGRTTPASQVRLQNQPVEVRADGTFTVRFRLPDSRLVIPCTAISPDGSQERRIVLALERNTRRLEPAPPCEED